MRRNAGLTLLLFSGLAGFLALPTYVPPAIVEWLVITFGVTAFCLAASVVGVQVATFE